MDEEQEHKERARPRVVDKRVSSRESDPVAPAAAPAPEPPAAPVGATAPERGTEMAAMAQQIAQTPSLEWVVNTAVTLANVAGTKLDLGAIGDAQLAIDALGALINGLGPRLGTAETPLRQTLAQLQMAYAETAAPPPAAP